MPPHPELGETNLMSYWYTVPFPADKLTSHEGLSCTKYGNVWSVTFLAICTFIA